MEVVEGAEAAKFVASAPVRAPADTSCPVVGLSVGGLTAPKPVLGGTCCPISALSEV
jgi:hypothetical protein